MLTQQQLVDLLADLEADNVERTTSTKKTDKFGEAVCAFANDLPNHGHAGYLIVGACDDGSLSGLRVTDELLKTLGAIRSDGNVQPLPAMTVQKYVLDGGELAVVEVQPSELPPVRYKGRVWIRIGPRRGVANEQEERILSERRVSKAHSFDALACRESRLDDLALGQFDAYRREAIDTDTIEANHRPIEEQLASLRLYDPDKQCLTHAGILLFGKNPRYFLPGAYIQYLRLPGTDLTDIPEDQAEVSGDLTTVVREMVARLKLLIQTELRRVGGMQERLVPNYPEWALRELLMNAVMHRNYDSNSPVRCYAFSDHIEIMSPGGLYGEATPENFPTRNSYRNPVIAEAISPQTVLSAPTARRCEAATGISSAWRRASSPRPESRFHSECQSEARSGVK
jgi:ATP-dependent DNA helicase RecG